jgi:hypothetical protein
MTMVPVSMGSTYDLAISILQRTEDALQIGDLLGVSFAQDAIGITNPYE